MKIVFLSPLSWSELQRNGYRKTAGAMFKALWNRADVSKLWYVQMDRRWDWQINRQCVDTKVEVLGLPIGLPYERFATIRYVNRTLQARLLSDVVHLGDSSQDTRVYWFYDWLGVELVRQLPRAMTVMEITDSAEQFYAHSLSNLNQLPALRQQVQENVNIVFPVTSTLAEELQGGHCKVEVAPNGISSDFLQLAYISHPEPEELGGLDHPRLCIIGTQWSLNYRVDHTLLLEVLRELADWCLVLIGCERIETDGLRKLAAMPQVRIVKMVTQERLVSFIQHSDVCAVPYIQGPARGDALKTYEYLACGKPVILTADEVIPELQPFVRRATDAKTFAQVCRELIAPNFNLSSGDVREILQNMTWDRRAERCLAIIRQGINEARN